MPSKPPRLRTSRRSHSFISARRGKVGTTNAQRASKNRYNTYIYPGLPPGPIDSPGASAIQAAAEVPKNGKLSGKVGSPQRSASQALWRTMRSVRNGSISAALAGIVWILIMTYICFRGIELSARIQVALLGIEVIVLVVFSVVAELVGLGD